MSEEFKPKYHLLPKDHPLLRKELERFSFLEPPTDPIALAHDLAEHLLYYGGVGLAANQIGLPYRVLVIKADPMIVAFNPIIVDQSEELSEFEEGCLTFPNLYLKIKRPRHIKVRYTEPNGNTVTNKYSDLTARIFQHEIDHLEGKFFTEQLSRLALTMQLKKNNKEQKTSYKLGDFR